MLTTHLQPVPRLRMSGDISPLPLYATVAQKGKTLPLTVIIVTSDQSSKQEISYTITKGQLQYREFLLKFFSVATVSKPRMRIQSVDVNFHTFQLPFITQIQNCQLETYFLTTWRRLSRNYNNSSSTCTNVCLKHFAVLTQVRRQL